MYCEQCGKHNEDGKQFCYNCGSSLIPVERKMAKNAGNGKKQPQMRPLAGAEKNPSFYANKKQVSSETTEKKVEPAQNDFSVSEEELKAMENELRLLDKKKNPAVLLIAALLIFAAVVAVLMVRLPKLYGAKQEAAGFETAMLSGKWDTAYDHLFFDEETSPYLTKEVFAQVMERKGASGYREMQVEEMGSQDEKKVFSATYETAEGTKTDYITLTPTGQKKFLFMNEWKVDPDSVCVSNVTIAVPIEADLSMNGIAVESEPVIKEDEHAAEYTIPKLFAGIWTAELQAENRAPYQTDVEVAADTENGTISLASAELYPDQTLMDAILNQFAEDYQAILEASVNREDFSVVEKYFAAEAIQEGRAQNMYANACSQAYDPATGNGILKYELSDISANFVPIVKSGYAKAGDLVMEIQSTMSYTYMDGGLEKSDTQQSVGLLCYHQEGDKWKIQSFS